MRIHSISFLLVGVLILLTGISSFSQLSLTQSDFPSAGDEIMVSKDLFLPAGQSLENTGPETYWDYSDLQIFSQDTLVFTNTFGVDPILGLVFTDIFFNPNRSNVVQLFGDFALIPGFEVQDISTFNYKSASAFVQKGLGLSFAGIPLPVVFNDFDTLYRFPVTYGDIDSSTGGWNVSIPALGSYNSQSKRINTVDGWGTLATPYGTFEALRMRTVIDYNDSIYIDSLQFGFAFPRSVIEYKWFGDNQDIPLLQINTIPDFGFGEIITSIQYRDELRIIAADDFVITEEDLPVTIQVKTNDSYGNLLDQTFVEIESPPLNGLASINPDGSVTYTPDPDFFGADFFEYRLFDTNDPSVFDTATVSIVLSPVNDPPQAFQFDTLVYTNNLLLQINLEPLITNTEPDLITWEFDQAQGEGTYEITGLAPFSGNIEISLFPEFQPGDTLIIPYAICDNSIIPPANLCDASFVRVIFVQEPDVDGDGFTASEGDCDDSNATVYPNAPGTGEDIDNNCNGVIEGDELFCLGDLNLDGNIGTSDLLLLLAEIGCIDDCGAPDLNNDQVVNTQDILIMLAVYGTSC